MPVTRPTPLRTLTLASVRALAAIPGAELPPDLLVAMRADLLTQQDSWQLVRELEAMFDLATGRARSI